MLLPHRGKLEHTSLSVCLLGAFSFYFTSVFFHYGQPHRLLFLLSFSESLNVCHAMEMAAAVVDKKKIKGLYSIRQQILYSLFHMSFPHLYLVLRFAVFIPTMSKKANTV